MIIHTYERINNLLYTKDRFKALLEFYWPNYTLIWNYCTKYLKLGEFNLIENQISINFHFHFLFFSKAIFLVLGYESFGQILIIFSQASIPSSNLLPFSYTFNKF